MINFVDSSRYTAMWVEPCAMGTTSPPAASCVTSGTYVMSDGDSLSLTDGDTGQTVTMPFEGLASPQAGGNTTAQTIRPLDCLSNCADGGPPSLTQPGAPLTPSRAVALYAWIKLGLQKLAAQLQGPPMTGAYVCPGQLGPRIVQVYPPKSPGNLAHLKWIDAGNSVYEGELSASTPLMATLGQSEVTIFFQEPLVPSGAPLQLGSAVPQHLDLTVVGIFGHHFSCDSEPLKNGHP